MNQRDLLAIILTLASSMVSAQQRGAKAIFVDTTSGATVEGSAPPQPNAKPSGQKPRRHASATPSPSPAVGIMYYIELISPSGQTSRVTADRTFRSGERILLHLRSSIDGDVEVFQREPDGGHTRLFPDGRVNGGSAFIKKNVDTVIPAPSAWFRFDDQAGTEQLIVVLTPRTAAAPSRPAPAVASAALEQIAPAGGSKGLLLETESTGPEQATYAIVPPQKNQPAEQIVVPITLKHQ